ncbi:PDR/VanB family oxidoreductase [Ottowia sp. VDI28]|uniref:PDR/VanB family oxidoreductase n=1 Tax=Ottowia sp. VDI28 TaxID=3133968 RepID=UPI003C2D553E
MDPQGFQVKLVAIRLAAEGTMLFELKKLDASPLPPFTAGAHIDVTLPNGLVRQYSLCNGPLDTDCYVIGVKRDRNSRGGSAYMHDTLRVGAVLEVSAPRNHFELDESAAHTILIAGGIGVTPIACMADRLSALGKSYELHYSVRLRDEALFLDRLPSSLNLHVDEEQPPGQFLNLAGIVSRAPAATHFYCCGPGPMLDAFVVATAGRPEGHVHLERFSADIEVAAEGGFSVELARTGCTVKVEPGQTILEAVRTCGVQVRASCEQGICGACETRVLQGTPDHRDTLLSSEEKAANDVMMICCSGSLGPRLVLDL